MNWTEISEKYPKAFVRLCKKCNVRLDYYAKDHLEYKNGLYFQDRDLYDFFDAEKLHIHFYGFVSENKEVYGYIVNEIYADMVYPSRPEAETAAFLKCFELLDGKLKEREDIFTMEELRQMPHYEVTNNIEKVNKSIEYWSKQK